MTHARQRAFSLIELLVVITIIAILVAITVPAIGGARDLARKASVQSQMQSLTTAVSAFQADEDRIPGLFNAGEMSDNTDGMTGMQNIILDLAGGEVDPMDAPTSAIEVGPNGSSQRTVNLALLGVDGANSKSYLAAGSTDFQVADGKMGVTADNALLPEIVDPWGMPIMAWQENEFAPDMGDLDMPMLENFAAENESVGDARFYWEQNAPILNSTALGERGVDQSESVLKGMDKGELLAALTGSPASPLVEGGGDVLRADVGEFVPSISRGGVIFQSAGRDRVFLSTMDKGYSEIAGRFSYASNFSRTGDGRLNQNPWPNAEGESGTVDLVGRFNDVIVSAPR